ncbi:MAG: 2-C-methyl-D-erythritol 2,4-cyclodiphosphate synthase [Acidobacteria bacterium]|nr:2-C-methyl-D-erythritol 2,4-cyclodiphosphate synthase [Acidobacteriota bacterium]
MNIAIIPAAGSGKRLGGQIAKQFLTVAGAPILIHTLQRFDECADIGAIVVALQESNIEAFGAQLPAYQFAKPIRLVAGGAERSDSILNALEAAREWQPALVAVHDAVRPFVTPAQISAVLAKAAEVGAAILAQASTDTIKEVENGLIVATLDRRRIYRAQTPQAFRYELLMKANKQARAVNLSSAFATDDALLAERLGHPVAIVEGSPNNIKITTQEDLAVAEKLFEQMEQSPISHLPSPIRVGLGNDIHRLVEGRKLILGGVEIPFEKGLLGHSDADALSHAITDAILGAAGLGDIGQHFSDKDPRWKDADSLLFLREAQAMVQARGYAIGNIDATIIAEKPKMMPHMAAMRAQLCATLNLDEAQINLKAKTNEKLDAVGRGEAIATHSVVLLNRINL